MQKQTSRRGIDRNLVQSFKAQDQDARQIDQRLQEVKNRTDSLQPDVKPGSLRAIFSVPFVIASFFMEYMLRTLNSLGSISRYYVEKEQIFVLGEKLDQLDRQTKILELQRKKSLHNVAQLRSEKKDLVDQIKEKLPEDLQKQLSSKENEIDDGQQLPRNVKYYKALGEICSNIIVPLYLAQDVLTVVYWSSISVRGTIQFIVALNVIGTLASIQPKPSINFRLTLTVLAFLNLGIIFAHIINFSRGLTQDELVINNLANQIPKR